jgi:hypothetical protein
MSRNLQPIQLDETTNPQPGRPPRMEWLAISSLVVDDRYQRAVESSGARNIKVIAQNFEWRKFSPVIVAPLGGGLNAIIDGQHRSTAALSLGYDRVPCYIVDATPEEAAAIFSAVNGNVTKLGSQGIFKAAHAAGEAWALAIDRACTSAGIHVHTANQSSKARKPYDTIAAARMKRVVEIYGEIMLRAVLVSLRGAADSATHNFFSGNRMIEWSRVLARHSDWVENPERIGTAMAQMSIADRDLNSVAQAVMGVLHGVQTPKPARSSPVPSIAIAKPLDPPSDKKGQVLELHGRKFTKSMIAAKTGLPYAKVEAILKEVGA